MDEMLSSFPFKFNLRRCNTAVHTALELHAAAALPPHMVPQKYAALEQDSALPLTGSGKACWIVLATSYGCHVTTNEGSIYA
jgi:hypothetical protein